MRGHDSTISCVNYWYNESLSRAAIETKSNFCDLGGNNYVVDSQLALDAEAKAAGINIIPDCGLAPGMVSILAMHGVANFDCDRRDPYTRRRASARSAAAVELPVGVFGRGFDQ
jgi:lysine 6-dehydrogenase